MEGRYSHDEDRPRFSQENGRTRCRRGSHQWVSLARRLSEAREFWKNLLDTNTQMSINSHKPLGCGQLADGKNLSAREASVGGDDMSRAVERNYRADLELLQGTAALSSGEPWQKHTRHLMARFLEIGRAHV